MGHFNPGLQKLVALGNSYVKAFQGEFQSGHHVDQEMNVYRERNIETVILITCTHKSLTNTHTHTQTISAW